MVQMELHAASEVLLVSTTKACLVFYTTMQKVRQVGQKPRDGHFGACFASGDVPGSSLENVPPVFAARPGARLWVADVGQGSVIATLKFVRLSARSGTLNVFLFNANEHFPIVL